MLKKLITIFQILYISTTTISNQLKLNKKQNNLSTETPDYVYQIKNIHSKKCLNVKGALSNNNSRIVQYNCTNQPDRKWKFQDAGNKTYYIKVQSTAKCIGTPNKTTL